MKSTTHQLEGGNSMQGTSSGQYDKDRQVAIIWSIEDVQSVSPDLTDEPAMDVLRKAERSHDATIGINWEVLENWADALFPVVAE